MVQAADGKRRLLTRADVAALFRVDVVTVWRWEQAGRLAVAARTLGGHARYDEAEVLALLAAR